MAPGNAGTFLRHIRTNIDTQAAHGLTDGQLLEGFIADRDESAFASLMRRHGQLGWGVCANMLHREQDVEDAFQATFMILVRRAAAIRKKESVASWLHGVAYRTARYTIKEAIPIVRNYIEVDVKKLSEAKDEKSTRAALEGLERSLRLMKDLLSFDASGREALTRTIGFSDQ